MRTLLVAALALHLLPAQSPPSLLLDLLPGPSSSAPSQFVANGGTVVFGASDALGRSLWRTDGITANTARLAPEPGWQIRALGGGFVCVNGVELRSVDLAGTVQTIFRAAFPIDLATAFVASERLFFVAHDGVLGTRIWSTDGTLSGTQPLDLSPGIFYSSPILLGRIGGLCAAIVDPAFTAQQFVLTDGTAAGTRIWTGLSPASLYPQLAVGEGLFFVRTDDGTIHVAQTGGSSLRVAVPAAPRARALLGVVGAAGSTQRLVYVDEDPASGREPWVTDGTPAGTQLLLDLWPGPNSSSPSFPIRSGGRLAFLGPNGIWVTDGTALGTLLALATTNLSIAGDSPWLERADGRLLLTTTIGGQRQLFEIDTQTASSRSLGVDFFAEAASGGRLLGRGFDPLHGNEPRVWAIGALAVRSGTACGADLDAAELHSSLPQLGSTWTLRGTRPAASGFGLIAVGAVPTTAWPLGNGCASAVDLASLSVLVAVPPGPTWTWSLPLPTEPALRGITLAVQAWFGPSTLPAGFESSNGLQLTFG